MGMADTVVKSLLQNLPSLLIDEMKSLFGLKHQIQSLYNEMKFIDIFLKSSEGKRDNPLVKEVVNHKAEDVADTYTTKVSELEGRCILEQLFHIIRHVIMFHGVNTEIGNIRSSIDEIYKNKDRYNIGEGEFLSSGNEAAELLRKRRRNVEEEYVVHDSTVVIEELNKRRSRRSVVSINGQCSRQCISSTKSYQSCTRSFIMFDKMNAHLSMKSIPERLKLARVLDFGSMEISSAPNGLKTLIHLRYLRLRVKHNPFEHHDDGAVLEDIVACMRCLWNLETLHLRGWYNKNIFMTEAWKFKRLRHLNTDGGVILPADMLGSDNEMISDLQTLYSVQLVPKILSMMNNARFPKLRKLGLVVVYCAEDEDFQRLGLLSNLHTLKIYNTLYLPLDAGAFLSNLTKITFIDWFIFQSHFMNTLGQLTNLQVLKLKNLNHPYGQSERFDINCAAGEFPKLEVFKMENIRVQRWTLERGAMPHLQRLVINVSRTLTKLPEELWSLTTLREVQVRWANPKFTNSLQNVEVKNGCKLIVDPPLTEAKPNSVSLVS